MQQLLLLLHAAVTAAADAHSNYQATALHVITIVVRPYARQPRSTQGPTPPLLQALGATNRTNNSYTK
jgi:hypothetical protein